MQEDRLLLERLLWSRLGWITHQPGLGGTTGARGKHKSRRARAGKGGIIGTHSRLLHDPFAPKLGAVGAAVAHELRALLHGVLQLRQVTLRPKNTERAKAAGGVWSQIKHAPKRAQRRAGREVGRTPDWAWARPSSEAAATASVVIMAAPSSAVLTQPDGDLDRSDL